MTPIAGNSGGRLLLSALGALLLTGCTFAEPAKVVVEMRRGFFERQARRGEDFVVECQFTSHAGQTHLRKYTGPIQVKVECPPGITATPSEWTVTMPHVEYGMNECRSEMTIHVSDQATAGLQKVRLTAVISDGRTATAEEEFEIVGTENR